MGNQLPHPLTSKIVECVGNKNFRACCVGMNGLREAMEDDHMMHLTDSWGAFGVFDGHAGAQCSQFCAKKFPKAITKANPPISDEKCQEISLEIDREFAEDNKESGSTAAIAIVTPAKEAGHFDIQVSNVGDSRVIVGRKMGQECVSLTVDHKPTLKAERERIEACGGTVSMDRVDGQLAMSRAIGDLEYKKGTDGPLKQKVIAQPDITHCDVTAEDFLLICCDGIFESNFSNEAVVEFLKDQIAEHGDDLTKICCALADEAVKRGSSDNITCMLVVFKDGSEFTSKSFIPGPYHPQNAVFRRQYKLIAERAGVTIGRALEMRHDAVRKQMADRIEFLKSSPSTEGVDETLDKLREEMAHYKPVPPKSVTGKARTQAFETIAQKLDEAGEQESPGGSNGGGPMMLSPELFSRLASGAGGDEALASLLRMSMGMGGGPDAQDKAAEAKASGKEQGSPSKTKGSPKPGAKKGAGGKRRK